MTYTDLIFDLYGTLVDIHTQEDHRVWEKTALFFGYYGAGYAPGELEAAFRQLLKEREATMGQSYECFPDVPFEELMEALFRAKGIERGAPALGVQAAQLFRICSTDYIRVYPGAVEALAALRRKGARLWLLSNAQRVFTAFELEHLRLTQQLDGICLSSDCRCRKPDRRFYQALVEERGLDIHKCLMIGNDRDTDIAGARAMGIATVYMHTGLTPPDQAPADPALDLRRAGKDCRRWEYEGEDWRELAGLLEELIG